MFITQLSVFLENKSGQLTEVTEVLAAAGINLSAMSIADNSDFGILRCIVSNPELAYSELRSAGFAVKKTPVVGFVCPNEAGALSRILHKLSDQGVFIEYLYSFNFGHHADVVVRPTDLDGCARILRDMDIQPLEPVSLGL